MSVSSGDVRATRIEIFRFCGSDKERREVWRRACEDVQEAFNFLWRYWMVFHTLNDSAAKIRESLERYRQWHQAEKKTRGPKPKWDVDAFPNTGELKGGKVVSQSWDFAHGKSARKGITNPPDLQNDLYHVVAKNFPRLTSDQISLILQKWSKSLKTRKAAKGNLPGWAAIILGREAIPSFTRRMPIPFTKRSCPGGIPLRRDGDKWILDVKVDRVQVDSCDLMLNREKTGSKRAIVSRIMSGEYVFMGSAIQYDDARNKWYAMISYRMPASVKPDLDPSLTLIVRPGRHCPWRFMIVGSDSVSGKSFGRFGHGRHVEFARRNIISERMSRSEHSRFAGSNSKGHGRQRGDAAWTKLSSRWKDFAKRYNNEVTKRISEWIVDRGIGRIVFVQPKRESVNQRRFLSTAGNSERSGMSWEYFQFATMLRQKCERLGAVVEVKQQNTEKTAPVTKGIQAARKTTRKARKSKGEKCKP